VYCSADDLLYGCVPNGFIYKINVTTGVETPLTSTARYWSGLTYNPTNSSLYVVYQSNYVNYIARILVTTGVEAQLLSNGSSIYQVGYDPDHSSVLITNYYGDIRRISSDSTATISLIGTCKDATTTYPISCAVTFNSTYIGITGPWYSGIPNLIGMSSDGTTIYTPNLSNTTIGYKLLIAAGSKLYAIIDEYDYSTQTVKANKLRLLNVAAVSLPCIDATVIGDASLRPALFGTLDGTDPTPTVQTPVTGGYISLQNATGTLLYLTQAYTNGVHDNTVTIPSLPTGVVLKVFSIIPNYKISPIVTITI
jgi:hypothetical protein